MKIANFTPTDTEKGGGGVIGGGRRLWGKKTKQSHVGDKVSWWSWKFDHDKQGGMQKQANTRCLQKTNRPVPKSQMYAAFTQYMSGRTMVGGGGNQTQRASLESCVSSRWITLWMGGICGDTNGFLNNLIFWFRCYRSLCDRGKCSHPHESPTVTTSHIQTWVMFLFLHRAQQVISDMTAGRRSHDITRWEKKLPPRWHLEVSLFVAFLFWFVMTCCAAVTQKIMTHTQTAFIYSFPQALPTKCVYL